MILKVHLRQLEIAEWGLDKANNKALKNILKYYTLILYKKYIKLFV